MPDFPFKTISSLYLTNCTNHKKHIPLTLYFSVASEPSWIERLRCELRG